jgi:hypothetical protein
MKLIRTRAEWFSDWDDAVMFGAFVATVIVILFVVPVLVAHEHYYRDVSVDGYNEVAKLAQEFPELKRDLNRLREDGTLTAAEINGVRAKVKRLRKARATRKFSEQ